MAGKCEGTVTIPIGEYESLKERAATVKNRIDELAEEKARTTVDVLTFRLETAVSERDRARSDLSQCFNDKVKSQRECAELSERIEELKRKFEFAAETVKMGNILVDMADRRARRSERGFWARLFGRNGR